MFSSKQSKPLYPPLSHGSDVIARKTGHKLGMILDENLDFKSNIREVSKARRGIGIIKFLPIYAVLPLSRKFSFFREILLITRETKGNEIFKEKLRKLSDF